MHFRPISDQNILDEGYNIQYDFYKLIVFNMI